MLLIASLYICPTSEKEREEKRMSPPLRMLPRTLTTSVYSLLPTI
jgi:hypothetical protein